MAFTKEELIQYVESELSKGNNKPYRDLSNAYFYVYRNLHRDQIRMHQTEYNKKRRARDSSF